MSPDTRPALTAAYVTPRSPRNVAVHRAPGTRMVYDERWCNARPPARSPTRPGSYQFKDADGRVIYVGKAKSLRQRLLELLPEPADLPPRTAQMVATAETVEWIQVRNDVEALMLEYSLIKQHQPRFNVRLRDDKSYPFLAVTLDDEWPRAMVMRGAKRKGVRYFGPYGHAYAIRETLDLLLRTFPIRTCSDNKFGRHQQLGRPCLLFHIEKCSRPVRRRDRPGATTTSSSSELLDFLDGDTDTDRQAARDRRCARRPTSSSSSGRPACATGSPAVRKAIEKQQMVAERAEDIDVIGIADDELEAAVQVFFVRKGRVVGRKGFVLDKVEDLTPAELVGTRPRGPLLRRRRRSASPSRCSCRRARRPRPLRGVAQPSCAGSKVTIRVPQRGDKRALQETVTRNAKEEFIRHRLRRAADHNSRARALNELQDAPRPARGPAAHRVLRHEPHPGHRLRRLDGGAGGRPAQEARVPPLQDQGRCRATTTSPPWRRCSPAGSPPTSPSGDKPVERARASSPTRRSCCWSTAARASSAWPCGCSRSWPRRRDPGRVAGQAVRGGLRARRRPTRSASPASPRRSTCCSASATRPTASPSPTTASCGASA